ncbi:MAG TPA: helix-turn-helix domain-containing protein [Acidimicrobiales bacterium]|nr:helix-turn-helix domain-containing protein [Acidimicrobiales bacterium]
MARTYGQFCALARSLDHVGDRWTLLIVRELLLGPARYASLLEALPGVPTNLLADRLRQLQADQLVRKRGGRNGRYELTDLGRGLEGPIAAFIRWGAVWMIPGPADDRFDSRWLALAVRALLDGPCSPGRTGVVELRAGDQHLTITLRGRRRRVELRSADDADACLETDPLTALALAGGRRALRSPGDDLRVEGDEALVEAAFRS